MNNTTNTLASGLLRGGTIRKNLLRTVVVLVMTLLLGLAPQAQANNGISAGLLQVTQVNFNVNTNVTVSELINIGDFLPIYGDNWTITQITTNIVPGVSTNYVTNITTFPCWNTGDYYVQIGGNKYDDVAKGVLISSVAECGRTNIQASSGTTKRTVFPESFVEINGLTDDVTNGVMNAWYRICTHCTNKSGTAGNTAEANVNVSAAWFPYDRYIGGVARTWPYVNGGSNSLVIGAPEVVLGTTFIENGIPDGSGGWAANQGTWTLDLRTYGINSLADGVLLVNHAKDEGNIGLSKANEDGTWTLYVHDISDDTASAYEQDPIAFVYVPRTDTSVISGKFDAAGNIMIYSGSSPQFTVQKLAQNGRYTLTMNSYAATNGVLVISPEGGGQYNLDNQVCYKINPDGLSFEIQSRDMPANGLQSPFANVDGVQVPEPTCSFVFIPKPTTVSIVVAPSANLLTAETPNAYYTNSVTNSFTVRLSAPPTANVTISGIASSDTTEGIVCDGLTSLTFTPTNWWNPQTVKVTGVDDLDVDGEQAYTIVLPAATSTDARFNGLDPADVQCLNVDNEAGISVSATRLTTTERGAEATFTVALTTAPTSDDTTITLSSDDTTEGTVDPTTLTFTSLNWSNAQTVTVTGVADDLIDGDITYHIITAAATSSDPAYNGFDPLDVTVVNLDMDVGSLVVEPRGGVLTVSEPGTTTTFTVALSAVPTANVTVAYASGDTTEGTVSPASVTFTPANWSTPQTFTLTAVDDLLVDGTVAYTLNATVTSTDPAFNGVTSPRNAQTLDNELLLTLPSGTLHYGVGQPAMAIDGQATVTDPDTTSYNSGSLTVTLTTNVQSNDRLEIRNQGTDPGQIGVSGTTVTYGGSSIGTFVGGTGATPLVITFNSGSSPESAQALARNIAYYNVTNAPLLEPRTVVFALADGLGATSTDSKQIVVGQLHFCDFQYGRDAGFGTYYDAHDCQLWLNMPDDPFPSGRAADTNGVRFGIALDSSSTNTAFIPEDQGLLRFDNIIGDGPGQIPPNATILEANLTIVYENSGPGTPLYRMLIPWNDPDTWNNMGDGVQIDGIEAETNRYSQIGVVSCNGTTGTGAGKISVLRDVQYWANGGSNYGWVLPNWPGNTDATTFYVSENENIDNRPRLQVTWMPSSVAIKSARFQQGVSGYAGAVDTRLRANAPTTNAYALDGFGGVDYEISSGNEDNEEWLFRFENIIGSAVDQIPAYAKIHGAVLELQGYSSDHPGDGGTWNRMLMPWSDTNTWNFWVDGIQGNGIEAALVPTATSGNVLANPNVCSGMNTIDLTADIQLFANGTPNYGWVLMPWPYGGDGWFFYGSDNATVGYRPVLRVYYSLTRPVMRGAVANGAPPTSVAVTFEAEPGKTYDVMRSPAVAAPGLSWTKVGVATANVNGFATYTDNSPLANGAYYKARTQ